MPVTRLDIKRTEPFAKGAAFGEVGAYTRVDAVAHYAVDPDHAANAGLADLALAPRNENGQVEFEGDVTLLVPDDADRASGALLVEVPNRGNRIAMRSFNQAPFDLMPTDDIDAGDGFLMRHGWAVAYVGWQWDMPDCRERLGLRVPGIPDDRLGTTTQTHLRIQPSAHSEVFALTDQHVGSVGSHAPIPPHAAHVNAARLLVRDTAYGEARTIPATHWRFVSGDDGPNTAVSLDGGFEAGRIYDLLYTPAECPLGSAGLLAVRDFAAFARDDADSPFSGVTHVIGEGISQCGRFLRTLLHLGLNIDESGRQVFDGVLPHIAGARRGEFNQRYGQPSVQPTPGFGHAFPHADTPQTDPVTGEVAGLLDRLAERNVMPKIVYTDTSSEYWRGDAGLSHVNVESGADVELPAHVRRYLFAGTQHGPGVLPYATESVFGSHGANRFNTVDYRPLFRAALTNLRNWVMHGVEPPNSCFPRWGDGTAAHREAILEQLADRGLVLPRVDRLPVVMPLDLGPRAPEGVGTYPARVTGSARPAVVSTVDDTGNETGGVRMPDVAVPVGVHTGFNPRHADSGGDGQLLEYVGSTQPLADVSIRHPDRARYLEEIRTAAERLAADRYVLEEDIDLCVHIAAERYDAAVDAAKS